VQEGREGIKIRGNCTAIVSEVRKEMDKGGIGSASFRPNLMEGQIRRAWERKTEIWASGWESRRDG